MESIWALLALNMISFIVAMIKKCFEWHRKIKITTIRAEIINENVYNCAKDILGAWNGMNMSIIGAE